MEDFEAREVAHVSEVGFRRWLTPQLLVSLASSSALLVGGSGLWISGSGIRPIGAITLIALSLALLQLSPRPPVLVLRVARICGFLVGLIGSVVLLQYFFGVDLGIDRWMVAEHVLPEHPPLDAALCVVLLASALELRRATKRFLYGPALLGLLATVIPLGTLASYSATHSFPGDWWGLTIMPIPIACTLALAGASVLGSAWMDAGPRWALSKGTTVAFVGALTLLLIVGLAPSRRIVRQAEMERLAQSEWQTLVLLGRTRTFQTMIDGGQDSLRSNLDGASSLLGEVEAYSRSTGLPLARRIKLAELRTRLAAAIAAWQHGLNIGQADGEARRELNAAQSLIDQIEKEARESLESSRRTATDTSGFINTVIVNGTFAGLVAWGCILVSLNRGAADRKRYETELRQELAFQQRLGQLKAELLKPRPANEKLQLMSDEVVRLFGAGLCQIWLIRPGDICDSGCVFGPTSKDAAACPNQDPCLHLIARSCDSPERGELESERIPIGHGRIGKLGVGIETKFLTNHLENDPELASLGWTKAHGLAAFAGYRIQSAAGWPLGVFAVFIPRPITTWEDLQLEELSNSASLVLMADRAEESLRRSETFLRETEKLGQVGGWEFDIETQQQTWTTEVYRILEWDEPQPPAASEGIDFMVGESRPLIAQAIRRAIELGEPWDLHLDVITAKGNRKTVRSVGRTDPARRRVFGFFQDITEQSRIERKIVESEFRFHRFMESEIIGIIIADLTGGIREANDMFLRMLGYSREEFESGCLRWDELTPPEFAESDQRAIQQLKEKGVAQAWEKEKFHKDGHRVPILIGAARLEESHEQLSVVCFVLDLTERKRAEAGLKETQTTLRVAMDQSQAGVMIVTAPDGVIRYANNAALAVTGVDREAMVNEIGIDEYVTRWELFDLDGRPLTRDELPLVRAVLYGEEANRKLVIRRGRGDDRTISAHAAPILDETGRVTGGVVVFPDITEQERAEALVIQSERRLRQAERIAHIGHWTLDVRERTVTWSEEMFRIHGVASSSFSPSFESPLPMCHPDDQLELDGAMESILGGINTTVAYRIIRPDGSQRHVSCVPEVACDASGRAVTIFGALQDTTEVWENAHQLQRKSVEMERFTYTISHDLKSPLITIKTFLAYLEKDMANGNSGRVEKDFHFIRTAADRMWRLLAELLQMSQIGRVHNPPVQVNLDDLIQESLSLVAGRIAEQRVAVRVHSTDLTLYGDRPRLVEIWQNLLENALKFMGPQQAPRIDLGVEWRGKDATFFVRDNGIGIDPSFNLKVFELFEKLDGSTDGTGLGLALVKRIVETYSGSIWCESEGEGHGSCFAFTLPAAVTAINRQTL